jgi:hypothetical protein
MAEIDYTGVSVRDVRGQREVDYTGMPARKRTCASRPKQLGAADATGELARRRVLASSLGDQPAGEACNAQSRQAGVSRGK